MSSSLDKTGLLIGRILLRHACQLVFVQSSPFITLYNKIKNCAPLFKSEAFISYDKIKYRYFSCDTVPLKRWNLFGFLHGLFNIVLHIAYYWICLKYFLIHDIVICQYLFRRAWWLILFINHKIWRGQK